MKTRFFALCVGLVLAPSMPLRAAGFASSDNFTVFTQDLGSYEASQSYAREVLAQAEAYRKKVAVEWFGEELPPGVGRTTINVAFAPDGTDRATTWPKDDPRRKLHTIYLTTNPQAALGSTLAHEIAHVVLATQYPPSNRIAAWLDEGIASQYDDDERTAARERIMTWMTRSGNYASLARLFDAEIISPRDKESYATATALTEFLLTLGDRDTLLAFGSHNGNDWDSALTHSYQIRNISELERRWQSWLQRRAPK